MELNRNKILIELERLRWSQSELARRMGTHRQQLNKILANGEVGISLKLIGRIADALGLDPKDLIK